MGDDARITRRRGGGTGEGWFDVFFVGIAVFCVFYL